MLLFHFRIICESTAVVLVTYICKIWSVSLKKDIHCNSKIFSELISNNSKERLGSMKMKSEKVWYWLIYRKFTDNFKLYMICRFLTPQRDKTSVKYTGRLLRIQISLLIWIFWSIISNCTQLGGKHSDPSKGWPGPD